MLVWDLLAVTDDLDLMKTVGKRRRTAQRKRWAAPTNVKGEGVRSNGEAFEAAAISRSQSGEGRSKSARAAVGLLLVDCQRGMHLKLVAKYLQPGRVEFG